MPLPDRRARRYLALALLTTVAQSGPVAQGADGAAAIARLSMEVQRVEDIRAVRVLQISYAHYAQFGLWSQMAALFAADAEAVYETGDLKGRAAI